METLLERCCGLDVHKETVQACVRLRNEQGKLTTEVRSFSTMTGALVELGDWLATLQVSHVAMESTGVYWKPVWNLLESRFQLLLVNARHVKNVPGRKSDVLDCQWIAQLLQHGLLRSSLVPDRMIRAARDLTRHRSQLMAEKARLANRIQKVLEDANIKLAAVASDVLGKSSRAMLAAIVAGSDDPQRLAGLALGRLQRKHDQLIAALQGGTSAHHRFLLKLLLDQLASLEALIARLEAQIDQVLSPFAEQIERLDQVPGIDLRTAQALIAETGGDMKAFPSAAHLCSWAGMCPGNHESAGKRKKGKTRPGNRWLRSTLSQCAWAASRTKNSYLSAQFRRLAARRGRKRAVVAVGRSILTIAHAMLTHGSTFRDLGNDWFDRQRPNQLRRYHTKRLEALGYNVTLEARDPQA